MTLSCTSMPGRLGDAPIDAGSGLDVLLADGIGDVAGGKAMLGRLLRIDPDAHRIIARTEDLHLADAIDARQAVLDVKHAVVAQIGDVVAVVRRDQVDDHHQVGRTLDRGNADVLDLFRQARLGLRNAVLNQLLRLVRVGAELEGHGQRHHAVRRRLAGHVEHALDAVDLLFERRRDRFGDDLRVGAGIGRAHDDRRRHDFRIFGDRQRPHADQAGDDDEDRQHAGKHRAVDKESGDIHFKALFGMKLDAKTLSGGWDAAGGSVNVLVGSLLSPRGEEGLVMPPTVRPRLSLPTAARRPHRGGCAAGR